MIDRGKVQSEFGIFETAATRVMCQISLAPAMNRSRQKGFATYVLY